MRALGPTIRRVGRRKRNPPSRYDPDVAPAKEPKRAGGEAPDVLPSGAAAAAAKAAARDPPPRPEHAAAPKTAPPPPAAAGGVGPPPGEEEFRAATAALARLHPIVVSRNDARRAAALESCGMRTSVTDAVISTMLSQNTTDANSRAAFESLKRSFPVWDEVARCDDLERIEGSIRVAGLAKTRAGRIRSILRAVREERGKASLEYLRSMSDDEVKAELGRFKGLGPKTVSCVLLFALGRAEFPVDTHVLRIAKRMGWVPRDATREGAYECLNGIVPDNVKLDLHCLLVEHGKVCHRCAANGRPQFPPKDGGRLNCPLVDFSGLVKPRLSVKNEYAADVVQSVLKEEDKLLDAVNHSIKCRFKTEEAFIGGQKGES